uniref:Protein CUSTOS n=1 Tax=Periophthalmus magnuspinnatus TaxID=409849 RepID=A0A3B3Z7R6_9GOBI
MTENSSSSDDEQLKRCREAVWDSPAIRAKGKKKNNPYLDVADHDHDGNELQVTQGFQIHVAKKLGAMLDRWIKYSPKYELFLGFRLFSTSVPGQKNEEPSPPKRRPIPSSSDSDSEMEIRLKEAAISIKDLIPPSTSGLPTNSEMPETPTLEIKENIKKKKKKKRKLNPEENGQQDSKCTSDNPNKRITQHDEAQTTKKWKKKKDRKKKKNASVGNSAGDVLN